MRQRTGEYFGTPADVALIRRAEWLWTLLRDDPRFAFFGRMVFLNAPDARSVGAIAALARLQGAAGCQFCADAVAEHLCALLDAEGLPAKRYDLYRGGASTLEAARALIDSSALAEDLTIVRLDASAKPTHVAGVGDLLFACGVAPVSGGAIRGVDVPGLCLAATDRSGGVVATASAHLCNHRDSPHAHDAFWGKLATREDRRGQGIGLALGARAIVAMHRAFGTRSFYAGVSAANVPSLRVCDRLGLTRSDMSIIVCVDPKAGATFTR